MFAHLAPILCLMFSSPEGWKFRKRDHETTTTTTISTTSIKTVKSTKTLAKEETVKSNQTTTETETNFKFEGNDGSWLEPADMREHAYHSEENCHSDSPQVKLTRSEIITRNKILNKARPWKVSKVKDIEKISSNVAPTDINTVYYINKDGDNAREHFMNLQLRAKVSPEVKVQRWSLANISDIYSQEVRDELKTYSDEFLAEYVKDLPEQDSLHAVSSYISTMQLLHEIQKHFPRPEELFVILEDDVQLSPDWEEELLRNMKHLPQDWDVARFVYWGAKRCQDLVPIRAEKSPWYEARGWKIPEDPAPSLLSFAATAPPPLPVLHNKDEVGESWYSGNQAYVIRAGSIQDILAQVKALPVMHVDGVFSSGHQEGLRKFDAFEVPWTWGIHAYALSMPLGMQVPHEEIERHDRPSLGSDL